MIVNDFQSYVQNLQEWEKLLIQDVEIYGDIFQLAEYFANATEESRTKIYATSDGSAPNCVGTFGWASKLSSGQQLAKQKGPATGYRTTSFRAEAYGLLSFLVFIVRSVKATSKLASGMHMRSHKSENSFWEDT